MRRHISINVFYLHLNSLHWLTQLESILILAHTWTKTKPKKNGLNEHKHDVIKHFTEFSVVYLFVICLIKLFACVCCYVALQNVIFLLYLTFSFFLIFIFQTIIVCLRETRKKYGKFFISFYFICII